LHVEENKLTAEIFTDLRKTGPFLPYQKDDIEFAINNTLYNVVVFDDDKPVGIARVVGDNRLAFIIKDVVVLPEYRNQGVGRILMEHILKYIDEHACFNAYIGLGSTLNNEEFYEKFGFIRRPNEKYGAGMVMFYKGKKQ
jgi:GNAT superfamily N-acetyltransferase